MNYTKLADEITMLLQLEHDSEYIVAELEMILDKMMFADVRRSMQVVRSGLTSTVG